MCFDYWNGMKSLARLVALPFPDLTGFDFWGSTRGGGDHSNQVGLGRATSITAPAFSPCIAHATVAGFDRIAWTHGSVTQKRPHIRCRIGVFCTVHSHSSSFSTVFSATSTSAPGAAALLELRPLQWERRRRWPWSMRRRRP